MNDDEMIYDDDRAIVMIECWSIDWLLLINRWCSIIYGLSINIDQWWGSIDDGSMMRIDCWCSIDYEWSIDWWWWSIMMINKLWCLINHDKLSVRMITLLWLLIVSDQSMMIYWLLNINRSMMKIEQWCWSIYNDDDQY